ncbi:MAG: hypothetical protein GY856_28690 [bacterium]|nr:hypothetical protein [bacterium]
MYRDRSTHSDPQRNGKFLITRRHILVWALSAALLVPALASARVTRLEIQRRETLADGMAFGVGGAYEKVVGRVTMEVDPADARNAVIQDLDLVPTNATGKVEYSTDFYILKPVDMSKGNGKIFYEANNRGAKISFFLMNDAGFINPLDPTNAEDVGNGFLLRQGYAIVWAGWEGDVTPGNNAMTVQLPIPTADGTPDGEPITEKILVEFSDRHFYLSNPMFTLPLSGGPSLGASSFLSYEAVSTDKAVAEAELRRRPSDSFRPGSAGIPPGEVVPAGEWSFAHCPQGPPGTPSTTDICLPGGFRTDMVYQLVYRAKNPRVMGLGYAATRDLVSFLRYAAADDAGTPNPLGTGIGATLCQGISSSGMYVRDFLFQGFNEDESGRRICDGMSIHVPGAHKLFLNYRFSQPNPFSVPHRERYVPDVNFPVTYQVGPDPLGELPDDGILRRCQLSDTCPKIFHTDASSEYHGYRSSLLHTDSSGNDLPLPDNVRMYLLAGTEHFGVKGFPPVWSCFGLPYFQLQHPNNPTHPGVLMRALLVALDEWVTNDTPPPASRIPTVAAGTLVPADQASVGFPAIPGVKYTGGINFSGERDFGPRAPRSRNRGVIDNLLPTVLSEHVNLVPRVNEVGIDLGGLNHPFVEAPVATLTGWNLRNAAFTEDDYGDLCGMTIPLRRTKAERLAAGDPRPSLEELYADHAGYVARVTEAAEALAAQRLMLPEDVAAVIAEAGAARLMCDPDDTTLCLAHRRFEVTATWRDFQGNTGPAKVVPGASAYSGNFFFFDPENWELVVKVLDGCALNGHFWVFAAGPTTVEYTLAVTDVQSGAVSTYTNELGVAAPAITDTTAFTTCP